MEFAEKAGSELAVVTLSSNAKILDATHNYYASEKLRKAFKKMKWRAERLMLPMISGITVGRMAQYCVSITQILLSKLS